MDFEKVKQIDIASIEKNGSQSMFCLYAAFKELQKRCAAADSLTPAAKKQLEADYALYVDRVKSTYLQWEKQAQKITYAPLVHRLKTFYKTLEATL